MLSTQLPKAKYPTIAPRKLPATCPMTLKINSLKFMRAAMSSMKLTAGLKIVSRLVSKMLRKKITIIVMKSPLEAMIPNVKMKDPMQAATLDFQMPNF